MTLMSSNTLLVIMKFSESWELPVLPVLSLGGDGKFTIVNSIFPGYDWSFVNKSSAGQQKKRSLPCVVAWARDIMPLPKLMKAWFRSHPTKLHFENCIDKGLRPHSRVDARLMIHAPMPLPMSTTNGFVASQNTSCHFTSPLRSLLLLMPPTWIFFCLDENLHSHNRGLPWKPNVPLRRLSMYASL